MLARLQKIFLCTFMVQLLGSSAWGRAPSDWLRVDGMPGVRLTLEHGAHGPQRARLRVGQNERVFPIETLPAGTLLYHWGTFQDATQAFAAGGLQVSLHPWDTVSEGRQLLAMELATPVALLGSTAGTPEAPEDALEDLLEQAPRGSSPAAWSELLRLAGLAGVYTGSAAPGSQAPGFRWAVIHDATVLRQVAVLPPQALLLQLQQAPWWRVQHPAMPTPLLQFLAVARLQEHGVGEAEISAALPTELAWFKRVIEAPRPLAASARASLWRDVPESPAVWQVWGFTKERTLCELASGSDLMDLQRASLCQQFIDRMCVE